jgi:hypothetical protein
VDIFPLWEKKGAICKTIKTLKVKKGKKLVLHERLNGVQTSYYYMYFKLCLFLPLWEKKGGICKEIKTLKVKKGKSWCYTWSICISSRHDRNFLFDVGDRQSHAAKVTSGFKAISLMA